jgi:hypothetical protein
MCEQEAAAGLNEGLNRRTCGALVGPGTFNSPQRIPARGGSKRMLFMPPAVGFLPKPFTPRDLLAKSRQTLEG